MRVAVIDVGSNTVRLLVADREDGRLETVQEQREFLGLGEEIAQTGRIPDRKLARAERLAWIQTALARKLGARAIEILVTAPGRQAENAADLVERLAAGGRAPVRVLSADEEGELAWKGAVSALSDLPESVAVCDVGGGSTEVVVGTPAGGPAWTRSFEVGSLRLSQSCLPEDPPGKKALAAAKTEVEECLVSLVAPIPRVGLAAGGTARALGKIVGPSLGPEEIQTALRRLAKRPAGEVTKEYRIDPARARTLPAGAVIMAEVQRRLEVPLAVSRAGLRDGAALALAAEASEEAAA